MKFIIRIIITGAVAMVLAKIIPGITIDDFWTSIILAFVLAILNALVKPLLILFTLPITIVTLGLFLFVINALIILLAGKFVDGFEVAGFWSALIFGLLLSFITSLMFREKKESVD